MNGRRLGNNRFRDDLLQIRDEVDQTKICKFQLSGITSGNTRVLTVPDASGTIALTSDLASYVPYSGATGNVDLGAHNVLSTGSGRFDGGVGVGVDPTGVDMLSVYKNSGNYAAVKIENEGAGDALVTFYDGAAKWILGYDSTDGSFKIDQNISAAGFTGAQDFVLDTSGNLTIAGVMTTTAGFSGPINGVTLSAEADGFSAFGGTQSRVLLVTGGDWTLDQSVASGAAPTFNNLKIEGGIPILIFKDNTDTGDSARGFQEWRDSNNVRLGFFGNSSYTHDDLVWKNESSGGHLLLETTGTGIVSSNADFTTTGDLTVGGSVTLESAQAFITFHCTEGSGRDYYFESANTGIFGIRDRDAFGAYRLKLDANGYISVVERLRVGSSDAPTVALDVNGAALISSTLGVTGVATLGDSSQMATSAAPTADADIANKKYVDDSVDASVVSGSYTGDGTTSKAITGIGFSPKYVRIFERETTDGLNVEIFSTTPEIMDDNANGGCIWLGSGLTRFVDNAIISLDADGFTVDDDGTDAHPNMDGAVYNYICIG